MPSRFPRIVGGLLCGALAAGAAFAQTPADLQRPAGNNYVAVGCLSREAQPAAGRGPAPLAAFIITDNRGETPTVYRLEGGDQAELTFHVGHTIQVEGPMSAPAAGATGPNAKAMVIKISSLVYLSPTCKITK